MADEIRFTQHWSEPLMREVAGAASPEKMSMSNLASWTCAIVAGVGTVLLYGVLSRMVQNGSFLIVGFAGGAGLMLLYWSVLAKRAKESWIREQLALPARAEPSAVKVSADGVYSANALSMLQLDWRCITDVKDGRLALHLMLGETMSLPLPDSDLPAGVTRDELRQRILSWRQDRGD